MKCDSHLVPEVSWLDKKWFELIAQNAVDLKFFQSWKKNCWKLLKIYENIGGSF